MRMKDSAIARCLAPFYRISFMRRLIKKLVVILEGGEMTSINLRRILWRHHRVRVGFFSYGSLLDGSMSDSDTFIGAYTSVGPNVRRIGAAHPLDALMLHPYWYNPSLGFVDESHDVPRTSCNIGNNVWIGANVTILPSCRSIGDGAVIGAGSIVTKDVEPYAVVAGVPARFLSKRLTAEDREILTRIEDWDVAPLEIENRLQAPQ